MRPGARSFQQRDELAMLLGGHSRMGTARPGQFLPFPFEGFRVAKRFLRALESHRPEGRNHALASERGGHSLSLHVS